MLISPELPQPTHSLHELILGHVGSQREDCFRIARHLDIRSSRPRLIKDHKSLMLGDARAPLDNREGDCIIDIPLAKLVTKGNSFELVLIEESGLDDPGHDLLLE